ncbi:glycosyl hydrolase family 8 [Tranquillimonas rosea]|nr:glycosyl hydrolase family 8 [Tranquillimonas rosea]
MLLALLGAAFGFPQLALGRQTHGETQLDDAWTAWKSRFLRDDGRVVDPEQEDASHSEGQGYGLLLAQARGDSDAFDRIERWTRANLLVRRDALMAWRWTPGAGVQGADWHNATDGDLFRAWALLRAARDSGWDVDAEVYLAIARDISASCLWPDPRAAAELLLRPSAEARAGSARVLLNPSYIMPRALRELGMANNDARLIRAADHGETCLAELAHTGRMPDWIDVTERGYVSPQEHDLRSAYDALRIPLYLIWSGRRSHPAVALARERLISAHKGQVVVARNLLGDIVATSDLPGYIAVKNLIACHLVDASTAGSPVRGPYYPASLYLLVQVADAESSTCAAG